MISSCRTKSERMSKEHINKSNFLLTSILSRFLVMFFLSGAKNTLIYLTNKVWTKSVHLLFGSILLLLLIQIKNINNMKVSLNSNLKFNIDLSKSTSFSTLTNTLKLISIACLIKWWILVINSCSKPKIKIINKLTLIQKIIAIFFKELLSSLI
jgi:hypothetical protein